MWVRRVDCLGLAVEVRGDSAAAPSVAPFLSPYAETEAPPALLYELSGSPPRLVRGGELSAVLPSLPALVSLLESDLYRELARLASGPLLHAAALGAQGRALVFAGSSGAGKSTLVWGLLARGFGVLSEECVLLADGASVRGLTRGLQLASPRPTPPGFRTARFLTTNAEGTELFTRLALPPEEQLVRGGAQLAALIILQHSPDAVVGRVRLSPGEALAALWPVTLNPSREMLERLADIVSTVGVWRFSTRSPEQAVELACALAKECGLAPETASNRVVPT